MGFSFISKNKILNTKLKLFRKINYACYLFDYSSIDYNYPPFFIWDNLSSDFFISEYLPLFNQKKHSLYIHFPFCTQRCLFCRQFSLVVDKQDEYKRYEDALQKEIMLYANYLDKNIEIVNIYIEGRHQ